METKDFIQDGPVLQNQFLADQLLQRYLRVSLGEETYKKIEPSLKKVGGDASEFLLDWAADAENHIPKHIPYSAWGERIDEIETSAGWKNMERYAAENGIVASGYERQYGEFSRVYQMSLLYLFHPSSAIFSCPLAMTDGAARAIELYGDEALKRRAYMNLTSRDPKKFWTSGQWMTEKTGGSDVSLTTTTARRNGDHYELDGLKWFTSATTSQMAMTLARIEGAPEGGRGLSLFYLELRDENNKLNQISIHRLKDKLGTKALPTAELSLHGTRAVLVGGEGYGIKKMASLFNITRVYNSVCSLAQIRRALALLMDYSKKRKAFGKLIIDQPLHQETLARMVSEFNGCFHLVMHTSYLLGLDEVGKAQPEQTNLLRILTPLSKLYVGKKCVQICSEVLEGFGGAGYVEDTGLPKLLRDGQVLAIWEGTTNILSLDVLRSIEKEKALEAYLGDVKSKLSQKHDASFDEFIIEIKNRLQEVEKYAPQMEDLDFAQMGARQFSFKLVEVYVAALLLSFAEKTKNTEDLLNLKNWLKFNNADLVYGDKIYRNEIAQTLRGF